MLISNIFQQINLWRLRNINHRQFILILSLIIGVLSGLSAIILKNLTHFVEHFFTVEATQKYGNYITFILPLLGITLTVIFVRVFIKKDISHGVTKILFAISKRKGNLARHHMYSSMIGSSLTVGLGGSVGLEAPIVLTGSSIGSNLGQLFKMNYKSIVLLLGCGAAGAIAGIFKAPIAAIVFALEVLMLDLTMWSIVPLLIASVTAASISYLFLGHNVVFSFTVSEAFSMHNLPFYLLLGVLTGLISWYFTKTSLKVESMFKQIINPTKRMIYGGIILCVLIYIMPPLFGEGYLTLRNILSGNTINIFDNTLIESFSDNNYILLLLMFVLILFKVIAMAITTGSGGVGGIFAPSLFIGGVAGSMFARFANSFSFITLPESNFALVGMAGVLGGVMHAPLTGIFLIAEITGGYGLFIPLIITTTMSYLIIKALEPHSLYTKRLAEKGELITHHKDKAVISMMSISDVLETDQIPIQDDKKLGDLIKIISQSQRNIFPVLNKHNKLVGVVLLNDIRDIIFNTELYDKIKITELMTAPIAIIDENEKMETILDIFEKTEAWNLPVTSKGVYKGFISRSTVFSAYREVLKEFSEE